MVVSLGQTQYLPQSQSQSTFLLWPAAKTNNRSAPRYGFNLSQDDGLQTPTAGEARRTVFLHETSTPGERCITCVDYADWILRRVTSSGSQYTNTSTAACSVDFTTSSNFRSLVFGSLSLADTSGSDSRKLSTRLLFTA